MPVLIQLTDDDEELAREYTEKVLKSDTVKKTKNYTLDGNKDRYLVGYRGELAFKRWLMEQGVKYRYNPQTDGKSDAGDFQVRYHGRILTVDVKTTAMRQGAWCMMPEPQFQRRRHDRYVGMKIEPDSDPELWGWAPLSDVLTWQVRTFGTWGIPTRCDLLTNLRPMEEFLEDLDR